MKIKFLLTIIGTLITITAVGNDAVNTPMKLFKNFRQAVIDNDIAAIIELADGDLLKVIRDTGTISKDLRRTILFVEAACEEVDVRLAAPEKALVSAFLKENGKLLQINVAMSFNQNNVRKIVSVQKTAHSPEPAMARFIDICKNKKDKLFITALSEELQKQQSSIPLLLQDTGDITVTPGRNTGNDAAFTITSSGIRGNVKMVRNGYFWKVSAIDKILCVEPPSAAVKKFCAAFPDAAQNIDSLKEYFVEKEFEKIKTDDLNEKMLPRFAAFKQVTGQKAAGRTILTDIQIDSETEAGTLTFKYIFVNDRWLITDIAAPDLIYAKADAPTAVVEKFINSWEKEAAAEKIKELTDPKFAASLAKKEPENELTGTVLNEEVKAALATVTAELSNCKTPGKVEYSLALKSGKWIIVAQKQIPAEPAEKAAEKTE